MKTIHQEIEDTDCDAIRAQFPQAPYPAYDYQAAVYRLTGEEIRRQDPDPFIIGASVSAGKTDMISMICSRIAQMNNQQQMNNREAYETLVISRQAEIISQDSDKLWEYLVQNSIFCAGLSRKASAFPVVVASEGTLVNALEDSVRKDKRISVIHGKISCASAYPSAHLFFDMVKKAIKKAELKDYTPFFVLMDECLTGESLIKTSSGLMRIDDPALSNALIQCVDEDSGQVKHEKPVRVFSNGIRYVSSVLCDGGVEIKCTGNHKLLSKGSWRRMDSLSVGDTLTLCGRQDSFFRKLQRACVAVAKELCQMAHL